MGNMFVWDTAKPVEIILQWMHSILNPYEVLAMMTRLKQTACISVSEHWDYNDSASWPVQLKIDQVWSLLFDWIANAKRKQRDWTWSARIQKSYPTNIFQLPRHVLSCQYYLIAQ